MASAELEIWRKNFSLWRLANPSRQLRILSSTSFDPPTPLMGEPHASSSNPPPAPISSPYQKHPSSSPTKSESFVSLFKSSQPDLISKSLPLIPPSLHHGEPVFKISQEIVDASSKPFTFTLVGKFSHGRSMLEKGETLLCEFQSQKQFLSRAP